VKWYGNLEKAAYNTFRRIGQNIIYWLAFQILGILFITLIIGFFISFVLL